MNQTDILLEHYTHHYRRVNATVTVSELPGVTFRNMELMYGSLLAGLPPGSPVVDIGCGAGILVSWLAQHRNIVAIGVDASPGQVEIARRNAPGAEIVCNDGLAYMQSHSGHLAGIFCMDVLEHVPTIELCLEWTRAALRALRPGGFFLCRVPNAANLTGNYSRYMDLTHARTFTSSSILELLEVSGFSDTRIIPIRAVHLSGRIRLAIERQLHRALFRICGRGLETVFTSNVCAVGFKGHRASRNDLRHV